MITITGAGGSEVGNSGEKLIVVMKNDASSSPSLPAMSPVMSHSLHMSPGQVPQPAPVFDSCYVPVNVCNTNNMMGGYGLGAMYGMNGMTNMNGMLMNGMGMNAYNGLGFSSGYGTMPLMHSMQNMYG